MENKKPRIVILGAGYAGILTARRLQKVLRRDEAEIVLVNKHHYHYLTTWLHETAAGTVDDERISIPIQDVIDPTRVRFVKDTVVEVEKAAQRVNLCHGEPLTYDYLVMALGFESATFGIAGIKEHALAIRSMNSARKIRHTIEARFADFARQKVGQEKEEQLTFVIGGAGFTGIEFAAELAERLPGLCQHHGIDRRRVQVINVEGAPGILNGFDPAMAEYAKATLEGMGVQFRLSTRIQSVDAGGVTLQTETGEERLEPATVIWTGGVQGNSLVCNETFAAARGRIAVEKDLRAPGCGNVFVLGDCSSVDNRQTGRPYPPIAQLAILQSSVCAENVATLIRGGSDLKEFVPFIKGTVASLGKQDAVGEVFGVKLRGKLALIMKAIIDIRYMIMLGSPRLLLDKGKLSTYVMPEAYTQTFGSK
ncbi:FAD-dependent oxidoreductase [Heliobacterium gestii]|uniref:FAD-dependent oxidoreductase n=1 Tax=Heliomicrobium gestii TaxID=2699 RepID=A0A845L5M3_HELGE|nr:NAD(P)/FAD-dependent oxidoreductase [Heliomicrobium gestii]MBM7865662.1 NADH dehydrogenase [Heliomicrobium gestii]MZP41912.1 FAD-dependent oxidoreductase [Heliomicrobium gestii]